MHAKCLLKELQRILCEFLVMDGGQSIHSINEQRFTYFGSWSV